MAFDKQKAKKAAKKTAVYGGRTVGDVLALIFKIVGTVILVAVTTVAIFAMIFVLYIQTLEAQMEISLEDFTLDLTSEILEFDHETDQYVVAVPVESGQVRHWVPYEEINRYLIYAAVAFEDRRFYEHRGVDWFRTVGAFYTMFIGDGDIYGASTITQQLIKNLTQQDEVTVRRKILEIFRAMELERLYTKEEILEWYLNVFALGGRINGVGAAAMFYYGVDQSELTLAQSASIVGITQFPSRYNPYLNLEANQRKRDEVLGTMYAQGYITHAQYVEAINEEIVLARVDGATFETPIYTFYQETIINDVTRQLMEEFDLSREAARNWVFHGGLQIYSAIDPRIQAVVDHYYADWSNMPNLLRNTAQSAIIIMDQRTGHIVGMGGRIGEKTGNMEFNMATDARRPPGSAIKPISVFGPAMELGVLRPDDMILDAPVMNQGRPWPQNVTRVWTNDYYNLVRAMSQSTNTVAVRALEMLGVDRSYEFMTNRLHIALVPEDMDRAPLALGQLTHGLTVREITAAFAAFANDGVFTHPVTFTRVLDSNGEVLIDNTIGRQEVAFRPEIAGQMTAMLLDAVNNGTGTNARLSGFDVAGKTGSTENNRDRYFVGYTPHLTAGVWTGFVQNEGSLAGRNPAVDIFHRVMRDAHAAAELPNARFQNLPSLRGNREAGEAIYICSVSGDLATEACRNYVDGPTAELFLGDRDEAPTGNCSVHVLVALCAVTNEPTNDSCPTTRSVGFRVGHIPPRCPIDHDHIEVTPTPPPETPTPTPTPPPETPTPTPDPDELTGSLRALPPTLHGRVGTTQRGRLGKAA
ncbi:MAG: transglycosylase domain-containing protein [Oscillospiraceae bacterium]|nr:transglycosylase domain-containing protein [Oscillospiraceae bacterium]